MPNVTNAAAQFAPSLIAWLDLFGIAVFAASGALAAAQRGQTLVTFSFFALVTGVGGGTVRDLLIGAPVFWVQDWRFAATCLVTAGLVWVTPKNVWKPRALDWFDAIGIAIYAVFGTWKSLSLGVPLLPAMMMGVITACVGGIIRDVLAGEPSILLKPKSTSLRRRSLQGCSGCFYGSAYPSCQPPSSAPPPVLPCARWRYSRAGRSLPIAADFC